MTKILSSQEFEKTIDKNKLRSLQIICIALISEIIVFFFAAIIVSQLDTIITEESISTQVLDTLTIVYLLFLIIGVYFVKLYYESFFRKNSMSKLSAKSVNDIIAVNRNNDCYFNLINKAFMIHIIILSLFVTFGLIIWILSVFYLSNVFNNVYLFNGFPAIIFIFYLLFYFPRKQRILRIYEKYFLNSPQQ
ncbi:MAG: hypothetical protein JW866_05740 [Ignavibacteriales bacterium]|nr:hypothetical protein [Ignavibacteriales bacterium]